MSISRCLWCPKAQAEIFLTLPEPRLWHLVYETDASAHSAAFCSGTILALSAVEDGITSEKDSERRQQAQTDLRSVVAALREVGCTWKTAHVSADVLEGEYSTCRRLDRRAKRTCSQRSWDSGHSPQHATEQRRMAEEPALPLPQHR